MSKQQLVLQMSSPVELINFLKRFSPVSNNLLMEIEDGYLKAKTHTPERSVVKSSKIEINKVFGVTDGENIETTIFGVFSLDKLIKSFSHFGESPLEFILEQENSEGQMVGTEIFLRNDSLKINFQCASLRLFTHITDEMMDRISDTSSASADFLMTREHQNRINALSGIDSDHKLLTMSLKSGEVQASSKSFNLTITNIDNMSASSNISVYKTQFAFLDKEDMRVFINDDRMVFVSNESDTKTIVGKAE
jgi:hypothetical protein